jgi:hypothetical protein
MNSRAIRDFAAENGLSITALHPDATPTGRPLTDDDAGFAIYRDEGRDSEDLGQIWSEPGQFVLERPFHGDLRDPNPIVLLNTLI